MSVLRFHLSPLLLAVSLTLAPTGGPAAGAAAGAGATAEIHWNPVRATADEVVLEVDLPPVQLRRLRAATGAGGGDYSVIDAAFGALTQQVGAPLLPVAATGVVLPPALAAAGGGSGSVRVSAVEVLREDRIQLDAPLLPRPADAAKRPGSARPAPVPDPRIYRADRFWPRHTAEISAPFVLRGTALAWLRVTALRYNPVRGEVRAARRLRVHLALDEATASGQPAAPSRAALDARLRRSANPFRELLANLVVDPWNAGASANANANAGAEVDWPQPDPMLYLIIHADEFAPQAQALADWKAQMGFATQLTPISAIGATPEAIEAYVAEAYNNWPTPPAYLLLLGDTNTIPADRGDTGFLLKHFTDLHYACVDGADWVPDLAYGRFPVRNADQAWHMVGATRAYERYEMPTTDWLESSVFIGGEDPNYWDVAEATHRYVISTHIVPAGMEYTAIRGHFGGNTQDISDAINAGTTVVNYSGHGAPGSWADPAFNQNNIRNLHNATMLPFVISNACDTGKYAKTECFGETWVRGEGNGGGGIAFYGASNSSYWDGDDYLERDIFDLAFDTSLTTLGEMTLGAQILVDRSGYGRSHYYYEIYNLMGDPALDLWFGRPEPLSVAHPTHCAPGHNQISVEVDAGGGGVDDALVALYRAPDLLAVGRTQDGSVTLEFDAVAGDQILVTVTGSGLEPYEGSMSAE